MVEGSGPFDPAVLVRTSPVGLTQVRYAAWPRQAQVSLLEASLSESDDQIEYFSTHLK